LVGKLKVGVDLVGRWERDRNQETGGRRN